MIFWIVVVVDMCAVLVSVVWARYVVERLCLGAVVLVPFLPLVASSVRHVFGPMFSSLWAM